MAQSADDFLGARSADDFLNGQPPPQAVAPAPASSWLKWPAVLGTAAVHGFDVGAGSPGDIVTLGQKYAPNLTKGVNDVTSALGLPLLSPSGKRVPPTSAELEGFTNRLGLTGTQIGHPDTLPQRLVAGGVSGATAAIPMIATGDPLGVLAVGGTSGLASGATSEVLPDSPLTSDAVGFVTGLGANSVMGDVKNLLALRAAKAAHVKAAAALTAAKDASFAGRQDIATAAANAAAQAKAQANAAKAALTPHIPPYEQLADKFAPTQTLQEAGEQLQTEGRKWLTNELPKRQAAAWDPVDKLIPQAAPIELPNYASALSGITAKGERLGGDLKSPLFDKLNTRLRYALQPKEEIPGEEAKVVPLTWQDARELRTMLGDALADPMTVRPIHQQDLNNLYRALTQDMGAKATAISPVAGKAFTDANATSSKLFDFAEGPLARVVRGKKPDPAVDPAPEAVARSLINSGRVGATDLAALQAEMPDSVKGLTAAFLRQKGADWSKLAPEAKMALAGKDAGTIDTAIAQHAQDQAAFNLAHKSISATTATARAAAAASARGSKAQLMAAQRNAQRDLEKANVQFETAKEARKQVGFNMLGGLFGGSVGNELGIAALNALGVPGSEWLHGAWGGLAGAIAPWALRSAGKVVTKPRGPAAALLGARAGTAATTSPPPGR